mmetsp:Transcript_32711/g.92785  ORF Transcript_32711/g.92785 Transcript_32711/m.92785 type:complete len:201 (+) Transcript_32711:1420-2022(+)
MDSELPRALLGGNDMQLGGKGRDGHQGLAGDVRPRHCQLQTLGTHQRRGDILQLQHRHGGQLLVDALEDVVVQVPRLVELSLLPAATVLEAPLVRLLELPSVGLHKGDLLEGAGPLLLHHLMQRDERVEHALHIALPKVEPAGLLQRLMPHLLPQDGDADELVAHQLGLLHECWAVLPHVLHDIHGGRAAAGALALTGHP